MVWLFRTISSNSDLTVLMMLFLLLLPLLLLLLLPPFCSRFVDDDDAALVLTYVLISLRANTASGFRELVLGCGDIDQPNRAEEKNAVRVEVGSERVGCIQ